ncbi:MAG: MIP family channel protein [Oscillospiraceae bacterium]|nr:MIP family channel protein [Oscillospiraceae bacterium]
MCAFKKYFAECLGTLVLVVFGCGVAIVTGCGTTGGMAAYLATAVAFGLVIVAMAYSIGSISGCHINPAVSIAMLVSGKLSFKDFIGYVIAQCIGAIAGAAILGLIFGWGSGFGANALVSASTPGIAIGKSLAVEIMLTAVFVFAILGVTKDDNFSKISGVVIGFTLILVHLLGIGLTGTSVNPARSLGPAIFAGGDALCNVWVFIVGPLVGGLLAACAHRFLAGKKEK